MISFIKRFFDGFKRPFTPNQGQEVGFPFVDSWGVRRTPTSRELVQNYREVAYSLANMNASSVAAVPLKLFVATGPGQKSARVRRTSISSRKRKWLKKFKAIQPYTNDQTEVEEVTDHPLLDLLNKPNEYMSGHELIELTQLYLEVCGRIFWYPEMDGLYGTPDSIWVLPTQLMYPIWMASGDIAYYLYGAKKIRFDPDELSIFNFLSLNRPYTQGLSPLHAAIQTFDLMEEDALYAGSLIKNRARPDIIVSPKDGFGISADEASRLEKKLNQKFSRGKNGRLLVSDAALAIEQLAFAPKDMELLARYDINYRALHNAYGVPLSLSQGKEINRSQLDTAIYQHAKMAVLPRLVRLCTKINDQITVHYDDRLFLWFDDFIPQDLAGDADVRNKNLTSGVSTINEEREELGMDEVEWGKEPWLSTTLQQPTAMEEARQQAAETAKIAAQNPKPDPASSAQADKNKEKAYKTLVEFWTTRQK